MKKFLSLIVLSLGLMGLQKSYGQLWLDTTNYTPQQIVTDFFDSTYVTVSNITYTGSSGSMCFFDASATPLGMNAGLLITTGTFAGLNAGNTQGGYTGTMNTPGDADLDSLIPGYMTHDAAVLEFDLVPDKDTIWFQYIFGSEEYQEFVGSAFNDVFGFFISGPGISGTQNIAFIPGTTTPVSINNVNANLNSQYYVWNDTIGSPCYTIMEYDGYTTPMTAYAVVIPDSTYHIKIGVADAGDQILDSGIFLDAESLGGGFLKVMGNFSPSISGDDVQFYDKSRYATSWFWDFGDGTTSTLRNPVHTFVNLATTQYTVTMIASNYNSADTVVMQIGGTNSIALPLSAIASVYPNPTKGMLNIEMKNTASATLKVYDLNGKVQYMQTVSGFAKADLSDLQSGVYFLQMEMDGRTYQTRLIKD
ncbi:MAG: choice-of-anchor L domain-containing protein [Bacteroidia bacterium]|nr:choice-of-anchor L domain-containing protein [Bacteroidia bacterium]